MSVDFGRDLPRTGTSSVKHDARAAVFGTEDVLPLWVADMDFAVPEAVTRALAERVAHPVYGYTFYPESMYDALVEWVGRRHGWKIERDWILMTPGVVPSLFAAVTALAGADEGVIVQPPVYPPFFSAVHTNGRRLIQNPLRMDGGRYSVDFEHLERCASDGARLLLLCSPHNPVARVWDRAELEEILRIARRCGLTILSDEIHADLVYPGCRHTAFGTVADPEDALVTAVAPSKTFNIPGLGLSSLIVPDKERRRALARSFATLHSANTNPLSIVAFEAAYRGGEDWLEQLLVYLRDNRDFVGEFLAARVPVIRMTPAEGTYLLWLDCRELEMDDAQLQEFFVRRARVGMSPGIAFGHGGNGFMRLNIASPRAVLAEALERIAGALASRATGAVESR